MGEKLETCDKTLTDGRSNSQDNAVAGVFDEIDDFSVVHLVDVHVIDGQDPVADVQPPATFGRRPGDDPADGGPGPGDRRDDDEPEALVLASGHRHVVRVALGVRAAESV